MIQNIYKNDEKFVKNESLMTRRSMKTKFNRNKKYN